jgi:hypothetical protein
LRLAPVRDLDGAEFRDLGKRAAANVVEPEAATIGS